jgi:pimeloyl-ACP methyl ester carboxylesterase
VNRALPALLLIAFAGVVSAAPEPTSALSDSTLTRESLTLQSAHGVRIEAEAGRLLVSENRASPAARRIPIGYLRLRSRAKSPRAPLFYLAGGPGQRAVSRDPAGLDFWTPFLAVSDVVLIDQRGVADPSLRWSWDGPPPLSYFLSADSAGRHEAAMVHRACAVFRARGVDLAGYTTVESASDLDALREALGMPRVSLLAFSYGTHLAFAYLRRFGEHVENAVLIGNEGPDDTMKPPAYLDTAFVRLARAVAADHELSARIPNLASLYDRVISRLEHAPMLVAVPSPAGGDSLHIPIGPFGLRFILRADFGDASDLPVFPRLLWSIDHADPSVLAWFVRKRAGAVLGVHGMNLAMDEASGASAARHALIAEQSRTSRFADVVNFPSPWADGFAGVPDLGDAFRAPLTSDVRALFVSGTLDCQTPPEQTAHIAQGFRDATQLVVENAGHEQTFWQNDTAVPVVVDFLAGRDVRQRKIGYPPLRFVPLEGSGAVKHPAAGP